MPPQKNPNITLNINGQQIPTSNGTGVSDKIQAMLIPYSTEISLRNQYIQDRDNYVYGEGLINSVKWMNGSDRTEYNWLERLVEIQTSQLMGRGFKLYSTYEKRDLSVAEGLGDNDQLQQDKMMNSKAKTNADARGKIARGMVIDNGGDELFQTGAASGSAFGYTVYKSWLGDQDAVKTGDDIPWRLEMLENVANYWAGWSNDSFRQRDFDVYMYQVSMNSAMAQYGEYLDDNQAFATTPLGFPLGDPNPIAQTEEAGTQPMVTIIEYTGKLPGFKANVNGEETTLTSCELGEETKVNILTVGGCEVRVEGRPDYVPRYWIIPNRRVQRRPWGLADVTQTCIDINVTFMERMSDWITITNRALFQKYLGKGYEASGLPAFAPRKIQVVPADADQSIDEIPQNTEYDEAYLKLLGELKENFVRSGGISQVLFDNPQLDANSNQALMTSMKGMIDSVERKQRIWEHVVVQMVEDAVRTAAKHYPNIERFVPEDEDWSFVVKWPSIMRSDDPQTMSMNINKWNTGATSLETFMEEAGVDDPSQEIDRLRDDLQDPLRAAIRGQRLPMLAEQTINPPPDPSQIPPEVKHNVTWQAALTPEQEANLANTIPGMQNGPFGSSMGPQGRLGARAENQLADEGTIQGGTSQTSAGVPLAFDAQGKPLDPATVAPNGSAAQPPGNAPNQNGQPGNQTQTPGVNTNGQAPAAPVLNGPENNNPANPGIQSQPGSGAPAVSPKGAVKQAAQRKGK